ncbi:hypothetical protein B0H13DRAFT_1475168, partial [Mycena leptocephala]
MVVAGDFVQLPPMTGPSLYSGKVTLNVSDAMDQRNQNAVLGRILWHQFNTVVMLRQNMRQKTQSVADDKLRTALENMRYGACTEEDDIRNVSIITARNSQKDALNKLGSERFARDTTQSLHHFCSIDRVSARAVDKSKWKSCEQSNIKKMSKSLQSMLWDAPPSATNDFIPGKLSICLGMPM